MKSDGREIEYLTFVEVFVYKSAGLTKIEALLHSTPLLAKNRGLQTFTSSQIPNLDSRESSFINQNCLLGSAKLFLLSIYYHYRLSALHS